MSSTKITNIDLPLGTLNNVGVPFQHRMTSRMDASAGLRKAQQIARTAQVFRNISKFKAIVLRIKHDGTKPGPGISVAAAPPAPASWADRIFSEDSPTQLVSNSTDAPALIQIWARIPEIHAGLTPPTAVGENASDYDNWLIDLHDIFIAESTDVPLCAPGDIVWVNYGNKNNLTDPIYLGPIVLDKNLQKNINGSQSTAQSYSQGGAGCGSATLQGSSPSGDSLAGKNTPATIAHPEFLTLAEKQKYIWWLYEHQIKHLPKIKTYWLQGGQGNRARLKAYTVWAADAWIKQLNAESWFPDKLSWQGSSTGWGSLSPWEILAQIVWGVLYRECHHNPVGILGNHPKNAIRAGNDTGYGMPQATDARFKREKNKDSEHNKEKAILKDIEQWQMLDPKNAIDFTIAAYLRLFRKYRKKPDGLGTLMKGGGKGGTWQNKWILGVWWAGSKEFKYKRKYNDIRLRGPEILAGADRTTAQKAYESILKGESIDNVILKRPQPGSPPGGGKDSDGNSISAIAAHEIWKATFTGTVSSDSKSPSEKSKSKGGDSTQLPSPATSPSQGNCKTPTQKELGHPNSSRGSSSTAPKLIIADIESKWKKGITFRTYKRQKGIDQVVIHESVGTGGTESVAKFLNKKGYGVHFVITRHGGITQHVAVKDGTSHAKGHNKRAVGIELLSPFYGSRLGKTSAKSAVIMTKWMMKWSKKYGHTGYLTNTGPQMAALYNVVKWIFQKVPTIAQKVPGQQSNSFYWGSGNTKFAPLSGVIPHNWCYNRHGDGLFAAHYMWCRLNLGMNHGQAYDKTIKSFSSVAASTKTPRWTNVSNLA